MLNYRCSFYITFVLFFLSGIALFSFSAHANLSEQINFSKQKIVTPNYSHQLNKKQSISNQQCISCHQKSQHDWEQSDHAKAMAVANNSSVLGDFNKINVEYKGQKAFFFKKDNRYLVTISLDNNSDTYSIKYTFGHFPLQQYLVETEQGKLQVLPFAWDTRDKSLGGQRWYHHSVHASDNEKISAADRLHWRQPLQNWNGMCADCHSDGLVRQYSIEDNKFDTQFDNINVGCLSCHGDMSDNSNHKTTTVNPNTAKLISQKTGLWLRNEKDKTAHWQGEQRDNSFMGNCFSCHALREPLTDGFKANIPFLDQFTPQLLSTPNYYPDGQIQEEVYVYGSFLQSKMFEAGVNCLDCHDKHTMKLKIEGNGVCLQCHRPQIYDVKKHHQHDENSNGAHCVNCHMPETTFMGVDNRRDHSFKIPRPDISQLFNTPNACMNCHVDKSNQWASKQLSQWNGKPKNLKMSKQRLIALNSGQSLTLSQHLSIIEDEQLDVISRATAVELLGMTTQSITADLLVPYLTHKEPLIRLSAAKASSLLSTSDKVKYLTVLLNDKYKSIRVAAARQLVTSDMSTSVVLMSKPSLFNDALKELIVANKVNSWRGEGASNQGMLAIDLKKFKEAEQLLLQAINVDPYFEVVYLNLVDLYRRQQRHIDVVSTLFKGIKNNKNSAALYYAFGLHYIRQQNIKGAISYLNKSMSLAPMNDRYAYTYILALDGVGHGSEAISMLKSVINRYKNKTQLKALGLHLSKKLKLKSEHQWFLKVE